VLLEPGLQRADSAHFLHGEPREQDDGRHLDDELHEVGPENRPHARGRRIAHRDDEAEPDGPQRLDAERDLKDLDHRERDPTEDDQVDRQREVQRAEAAQERGGPAAVTDLGELHVGHHLRAPPEPRVEEHRQRAAHDEVPPEPVAGDSVRGDEAGHDERRVGGERRRDHRRAREPPRHGAPRDEVLLERLAALLREGEADADREDEVRRDDGPVEERQAHGLFRRGATTAGTAIERLPFFPTLRAAK
jgi:hypothetical protein